MGLCGNDVFSNGGLTFTCGLGKTEHFTNVDAMIVMWSTVKLLDQEAYVRDKMSRLLCCFWHFDVNGYFFREWPGKANMEGNFDAIFKCPEPSVAKSRALLPVLYSHKARNMQECPRSPQGAANKELNSNTDNCCLPLLCVCACLFKHM